MRGKYEWKIDSLASIKFTIAGTYKKKDQFTDTYSEALNEEQQFVNTNQRTNDMTSEKKQLDNVLTYKQLFKKKDRQILTTLRLGLIDDNQNSILKSSTNFYREGVLDSTDLIDQQKINTGNSTTVGAKITYNEPLTKELNLVTEYSLNSNNSVSHWNSFDKDLDNKYTSRNPTFSSNFDLNALSNSGTVTLRSLGKKLRMALGAGLSAVRLNLHNIDNDTKNTYNFTGFTPQAQFGYKLKAQTQVSLSYRGNTVQPTITQLQPLRNNNDPLRIYIGNPDLKVGFNHNVNLNFNDFKVLSGRYLFGNAGLTFQNNAITNLSTTDSFGKTTYIPVNVKGNYNYYLWSSWNSGQGEGKLAHEISPRANGGKSMNFINGKSNTNTYGNLSLRYGINYRQKEKYSLRLSTEATRNISKSSLRPNVNNNYWSYQIEGDGFIALPFKLELHSEVEMNLRQKTAAFPDNFNTTVWNADLARKFLKDKSLKVSVIAHDILNQNIGFSRTINSNFINEQRYDRLARYFLFQVSWNFNKMPGAQQ